MKRRNFLRGSALLATSVMSGKAMAYSKSTEPEKQIYEWRTYHFKSSRQKRKFDEYFRDVLMPSISAYKVKCGAFSEYSMNEPPKGYYLFVFPSISNYQKVKRRIWSHVSFLEKSKDFFKATEENGAYERFETYLLEAFDGIPELREPEKGRGLFELRIYESNNEEAGQRKIRMFNNEELGLFDKNGLNSTFFGEVLAGPQMPALVYMLWFKDMDERNANWAKFNESKEWDKLKSKKEYENTVSKVNKTFLLPMDFSQI